MTQPNQLKAYRENIIFHELGHCILDQEHRSFGIMSPDAIAPGTFNRDRAAFLDELFGKFIADRKIKAEPRHHPAAD